MYDIRFHSQAGVFEPVLIKGVPPGYSLLEVALESDIELHHNCGMVCSCSSCHIYVQQGQQFLSELSVREQEFLVRAYDRKPNSRLACQSVLIEEDGYLEVIIPDQSML